MPIIIFTRQNKITTYTSLFLNFRVLLKIEHFVENIFTSDPCGHKEGVVWQQYFRAINF